MTLSIPVISKHSTQFLWLLIKQTHKISKSPQRIFLWMCLTMKCYNCHQNITYFPSFRKNLQSSKQTLSNLHFSSRLQWLAEKLDSLEVYDVKQGYSQLELHTLKVLLCRFLSYVNKDMTRGFQMSYFDSLQFCSPLTYDDEQWLIWKP